MVGPLSTTVTAAVAVACPMGSRSHLTRDRGVLKAFGHRRTLCNSQFGAAVQEMSPKALVDAFQQGPPVLKAVLFVGLFVIINTLFFLVSVIYRRFLRPGKNLKKYGMWGKGLCAVAVRATS